MKERPKSSAFLLIAAIFLCIYLVKTYYNAPPASRAIVERASKFDSAGARLVYGLKVDINSATASDLELLPGIGPVLAARIVAERRVTGGFNKVNELVRVKGLSPGRLKTLAPYITVGG